MGSRRLHSEKPASRTETGIGLEVVLAFEHGTELGLQRAQPLSHVPLVPEVGPEPGLGLMLAHAPPPELAYDLEKGS